jgi:hypothetical protein
MKPTLALYKGLSSMNCSPVFNRILAGATLLMGFTLSQPAQAFSLTGFQTTGSQMGGIQVTANYLGGGSQTALWNPTGLAAGGAFGSGWSLTQVGDTYTAPWTFSTNAGFTQQIASLIINAIPGNTVFDTISETVVDGVPTAEGTPGSGDGKPFTVLSGQAPSSFAYSTDIAGAENDLKGVLSLFWTGGFTGQLSFLADTDKPIQEAVPEPTTIAGIALAAAGLARLRRRQRQA